MNLITNRNYERSNIKIKKKNQVKRELGIVRCGLACFLCENDCHKGLLSKMKPYGFTVFAKRYGLEALLDCLERNEKNGVIYHREELIGDYDNSYLPDWKIERQGDGILCRNI
jgi:hypothetical protein